MNTVNKLTIKDLAFTDRPREKLMIQGKSMMTNAELLAIIIGSGNQEETAVELSERMLNHFDNNLEEFVKLDVAQLCKFKGIGEAKAITIIAALELSYRREHKEIAKVLTIDNSQALYHHLIDTCSNTLEDQIWIILLNSYNRIILTQKFDRQTRPEPILDAKILYQFAIENQAAYMAVCKRRADQSLYALQSDLCFVKEAVTAGNMLGVPLWDFLTFNDKDYLSYSDGGFAENRIFHT
jgi:DNA repair protein RadC